MALQYIGARYVPKFYQGSQGTEWEPNVIYEPLTIVTYLSNSYTSMQAVPAAVGNPQDNPTYWAATGNYNAQVEELRGEVANNSSGIEELTKIVSEGSIVTPEQYGAKGDGITNDYTAFYNALQTGKEVMLTQGKTYYINGLPLNITEKKISGRATIKTDSPVLFIVDQVVSAFIQGLKAIGNGTNTFISIARRGICLRDCNFHQFQNVVTSNTDYFVGYCVFENLHTYDCGCFLNSLQNMEVTFTSFKDCVLGGCTNVIITGNTQDIAFYNCDFETDTGRSCKIFPDTCNLNAVSFFGGYFSGNISLNVTSSSFVQFDGCMFLKSDGLLFMNITSGASSAVFKNCRISRYGTSVGKPVFSVVSGSYLTLINCWTNDTAGNLAFIDTSIYEGQGDNVQIINSGVTDFNLKLYQLTMSGGVSIKASPNYGYYVGLPQLGNNYVMTPCIADTEANIKLTTPPPLGFMLGFATDTLKTYVHKGGSWYPISDYTTPLS